MSKKTKSNIWLTNTDKGLYCLPGNFYIDPYRPVEYALISHGHADHARAGHDYVLSTSQTLDIMRLRYGPEAIKKQSQIAETGTKIKIRDVDVTFFPAGHILGSAQILLEYKGQRIVFSGDYKRQDDATCSDFELVLCDIFITEATFGLPVFRHPDVSVEIQKLMNSLKTFPDRAHLIGCYALGKAQRVLKEIRLAGYDKTIFIHGALHKLIEYYQAQGIDLGDVRLSYDERQKNTRSQDYAGAVILAPPSAIQSLWARRFKDAVLCMASGWMRIRQRAKQRGIELPMIISDHADWDDLTRTILETNAREVWVTHGREEALVHWCRKRGLEALPLSLIGYGDENEDV